MRRTKRRYKPKSLEEAFSHQIVDDAYVVKGFAILGPEEFENALKRLELTIATYRNRRNESDGKL
jgi:hypothetical protein